MIKLSVAIITFNEERNIERCIQSVLPVADEIIVVDSLSTDKTIEIAKSLGALVIPQKFLGHIEQKNLAIEKCANPYVLSLDADEALSPELTEEILRVKNNWEGDGYQFNRLTNYCGKWIKTCGWYPDTKNRLFMKGKGKWEGVNPHDTFVLNPEKTTKLKGDLLHYSFYTIEQHKKQIEYFSDIAAKAYFDQGKKTNLLKASASCVAMFVKSYFIQLGILDGYYGFIISWYSAGEKFKKYRKLSRLHMKDKN